MNANVIGIARWPLIIRNKISVARPGGLCGQLLEHRFYKSKLGTLGNIYNVQFGSNDQGAVIRLQFLELC